ncbi:hypothetical protein NBRC116188_00780 [Oceaniserpentilla sp. 4NH20-0058]|uniref:sensor domain-containing diguanylate cyclase n=1 Tax=Oceaniserpentilla sp. 4NH20-0058 TaxID=3127660 RepID=UPI0031095F87
MKLRTLIMLAALTYVMVIGGGLLFYRLFIAYPELERITLAAHQDDFQIIQSTYENDLAAISYLNLDWAKWDDIYEFAKEPNKEFIDSNIYTESFKEGKIDAISIFNEDKKHVFSAIKTKDGFTEIPSLLALTSDIDIDLIFKHEKQFGLLRLNGKFAYFSSRSIQDSKELLPTSGRLIFISLFGEEFKNRIKRLTGSNIKAFPIDTSNHRILPTLDPEKITTVKQHYKFYLKNHNKKPIAILKIDYPNNPLPEAIDNITIFSISILIMLPIIITVLVYFLFLRPLTFIFNKIGEMKHTGKLSDIKIHTHIYEIDEFTKSFNGFIIQIQHYQFKLKSESITDSLTKLNNRRYFDKRYDEIWRTCIRQKDSLAIILMDIDYFKKYNDNYGHQKGDEALQLVSKQLSNQARRGNELLARYGGEEFILVIENINHEQLTDFLDNLLNSIRDLNIEHCKSEVSDNLTISCGACIITSPGSWMNQKKEAALKQADDNLYQSKANGRDRFLITAFKPPKP